MLDYELLNAFLTYGVVFLVFSNVAALGFFSYFVRAAIYEILTYLRKKRLDKSSKK